MGNQVLRNGLIIAGSLIAAYFVLHFFGVFGHSAANVAQGLEGKF